MSPNTPALPEVRRIATGSPGPVVALLGGVHGDEYEGVLAARRLAADFARSGLRGELRWAAPANPAAWAAGTRCDPEDGTNLARVFPGSATGSAAERIADHLTRELIAGADLLIDLHSAGSGFEMPLLCGYASTGPLAASAAHAAKAFAAPITWQHPVIHPGRSLSAAADLGVPSLYVEGRGGRQIRATDLDLYTAGVRRVLADLEMLPPVPPGGSSLVVSGDGDTDGGELAPLDGYLVVARSAGDLVEPGGLVAQLLDDQARVVHEFRAIRRSAVMLLVRSPWVRRGDTVLILANVSNGAPS
ncbi:M14 family metallopeptidase [Kribbella sp.]|uniref:succinylglutamate desuccinylase/aspartoacylase family protein n=1 Tax=Kribbella sp. TaxID=1871183 RepID=UPI002D6402C6|nr:M14 family metallopeptidase [Kribbella sp.]HZX07819.1 M14 family metallopeptidase [Kribbella sp.]